jgi:8-oxo-dGTP diphosphatase
VEQRRSGGQQREHAAQGAATVNSSEQPAVDIRVALFTVAAGQLWIAFDNQASLTRLPRGIPFPAEQLDAAARRIVRGTTGIQEQYLEQLYTLSVHEDRSWEILVSYIALLASDQETPQILCASWYHADAPHDIAPADQLVVDYALVRLRAKLGYTNIAFHLLPETFTLSELQGAYEAILGRRLDKRNFRRRVIAAGILLQTNQKRRDVSHRPAALYRFRAEHDPATYLTPPWAEDS